MVPWYKLTCSEAREKEGKKYDEVCYTVFGNDEEQARGKIKWTDVLRAEEIPESRFGSIESKTKSP